MIEVIVTIVISAIALSVVMPLLSRVFLRSHEPRVQLRDSSELHTVMENMVASLQTNRLTSLQAAVGAEGGLLNDRITVVRNRFVGFTGNVESASPTTNTLLKITLKNALGEEATRLFVEAR